MDRPVGVQLVVAGVDVQDAYLAALVCGFSRAREVWCLDYLKPTGSVRDGATLPSLLRTLVLAGAQLIGVDSGFATDAVYQAVAGKRGVTATKGEAGEAGEPIIIPSPHHVPGRVRPLRINTCAAKDEVTAMLATKEPGRNFVHVPKRLGAGFLAELTSEERVPRFDAAGVECGARWVKKSATVRNEGLDCFVICLALFHSVAPTQWAALLNPQGNEPRCSGTPSPYLGSLGGSVYPRGRR